MSQPSRDSGYTLIEVMVTIALMVALLAIAVFGWASWARANEQSGAARELQATLRDTQQRAVTEGAAMCVTYTDAAFTVWRGSCATPAVSRTRLNGPITVAAGVHLASPDAPGGVTFSARGTSTGGSINVTRNDSSKVYTLQVEGFTGRVSLN